MFDKLNGYKNNDYCDYYVFQHDSLIKYLLLFDDDCYIMIPYFFKSGPDNDSREQSFQLSFWVGLDYVE